MNRSDWSRFVTSFLEEYFDLNPAFAAGAGRHEFDGRLPDWSEEGLRRKIAWLHEQRAAATAFGAGLDPAQSLEREHLIAQLDAELFWMADAEIPWRNPLFYSSALDPAMYLTRDYAPLETRMRAFVRYARAVPRATEQVRANLRTPLPRTFAQVGRLTLGGLADYYEKDVPPIFASVADPALQAELREAIAGAAAASRDLNAWFTRLEEEAGETEDDDGRDGFAFGPERYRRMLRDSERVDLPLEVLEAAGRRELERNLAALRQACAASSTRRSW